MISYRGRKKQVSDFIINNLPPAELFIDVFGGSAAVSLAAVESGKYNQVVYNDLDGNMVNFMKVVRDSTDELVSYINATPLGRYLGTELESMLTSDDDLVRATGVFFACNFQGKLVAAQTNSFKRPIIRHKNSISNGWKTRQVRVDDLYKYRAFLKDMYFENLPAEKVIGLYSKVKQYSWNMGYINIVFFLDPPYGLSQEYPEKFHNHKFLRDFFDNTKWTVAWCMEADQRHDNDSRFIEFKSKNGTPTITTRADDKFRHGMLLKNSILNEIFV